jgi:hypothetical protein
VGPARAHADWPQFALVDPALPGGSSSARNVFTFREAPRPVVPVQVTVTKTPDVVIVERKDDKNQGEQPKPVLDFPYRYIGRFGPEGEQLAAFVANGEVKLAKAGDLIDGKYLLRTIGIESAEVALAASPELSKVLEIGK